MKSKLHLGWYRIKKYYRGGIGQYGFRLTRFHLKHYSDWEEILQLIGEKTNGGYEDGYRIEANRSAKKPKKLKEIKVGPFISMGVRVI